MNHQVEEIRKLTQKYIESKLPVPRNPWPHNVCQALAFINENLFDEVLTIAHLKRECRINSKSFSSRFRIHVGSYPKEYIVNHRISLSKELLTIKDINVVHVALHVGFSSHSAFCKSFKEKVGVIPSEWQNKAKQNSG